MTGQHDRMFLAEYFVFYKKLFLALKSTEIISIHSFLLFSILNKTSLFQYAREHQVQQCEAFRCITAESEIIEMMKKKNKTGNADENNHMWLCVCSCSLLHAWHIKALKITPLIDMITPH